MDNSVAGPLPPPGHDHFSQSQSQISQSSMRSATLATSNQSNGGMALQVEERPRRRSLSNAHNNFNTSQGHNGGGRDHHEEEPESQESFTQQLTQGNELTQLGFDGDDDHDGDAAYSQTQDGCATPTPIDPLTIPWGRLMPVGPHNDGHNNNNMGGQINFQARPSSSRGATEMLPRSPTRMGSATTRSRSPSVGGERGGGSNLGGGGNNNGSGLGGGGGTSNPSPPSIHFLGLKNLLPSDRFNEYVLGRSVKADVTAQKLDVPASIPTETDAETQQRNESRRRRHDYVHAMVSNRHCKIFCLLSNTSNNGGGETSGPPEMEVFVEDTSGNGTLVNGTTLLRKNERRKLHTGDVICLLNPKLLAKKLRSPAERKMYGSQYSYVFVNVYEQEARHGWGVDSTGKLSNSGGGGFREGASPVSTAKKSAVDVRAMRCHSNPKPTHLKGRRSLFSMSMEGAGRGKGGLPCQQLRQPPPSSSGGNALGLKGPLNLQKDNTTNRRRVEEEYDLRDLLGTGTCGEVRRAIHRRTGEERAVKVIQIGGRAGTALPGMSSEKLSAIQAEAEILRALDHPYVVRLFDVFIAPGKAIYLVMEMVRGGDLFDRIVQKERYDEVQARRIFRRILAAVHYLHEEKGIVHRDLKPENILVVDRQSDVNIKLTDFGLAKSMTAEGLKTFCGTPQYFAPEVLRRRHTVKGNGRYGKEIDCWSIGVILFILLSGSPPFDVSGGFDAVANAEVAFYKDQWRHVSKEARELVMRLLEKDPRRRMSVKDACDHAWLLVDDGDTHCHPLHDPVVSKLGESTKPNDASDDAGNDKSAEPAVETKGESSTALDADSKPAAASDQGNDMSGEAVSTSTESASNAKDERGSEKVDAKESLVSEEAPSKPPSSPFRKACAPVDANSLSPASAHNKKQAQPQPARQPAKGGRCASIWPTNGGDKTVTKAIQQNCHTSKPSPNSSPIKKRHLFDEPTAPKKMSRQNVESIKAAGNTLPKPAIDEKSRLVKKAAGGKKKVQSTLFAKAGAMKGPEKNSKPASNLPQKDAPDNDSAKPSRTSTVTPPGTEQSCGLVFRLSKKHKMGGKHISPETRGDAGATSTNAPAPAKKSELSEDELQSDFSDDEEAAATQSRKSLQKSEKKPLEKYLRKRKMDSIESVASVDRDKEPKQRKTDTTTHEDVPRPVSKESIDSSNEPAPESKEKPSTDGKSKDRKKVQTYLFGKPPPGNGLADEPDANSATDNDDPEQQEGEVELQRQPSGEPVGAAAAPKGKQRTIKSWFQPKK
ncbi:hypothetical protein ACHAXT_009733 [Thalassiosira profunda]